MVLPIGNQHLVMIYHTNQPQNRLHQTINLQNTINNQMSFNLEAAVIQPGRPNNSKEVQLVV